MLAWRSTLREHAGNRDPWGKFMTTPATLDVLVVGAGFGGLYAVHRLRGAGFSVHAVEAGGGVGGTWYWNRYPGARCDAESLDYSFSIPELEQAWDWSERFATQPEILRYIEWVADRLDLRRSISFNTRVTEARWDAAAARWRIATDVGDSVEARHLILATGSLSAAKLPDIDGAAEFGGRTLSTAQWPHEGVDVSGQRVGIIGTGSSGIQAIPLLAEQAGELVVFQRTAGFSIPARNAPHAPEHLRSFKARYQAHRRITRETRPGVIFRGTGKPAAELDPDAQRAALEDQWTKGGADFASTFTDFMLNEQTNDIAAEFVREKIRALVKDPATAEALTPRGFPIASKRLCLDTNYYETFNRPNVKLVDLRTNPIERIVPAGVRTRNALVELDVLIFATGFDAMTGSMLRIDVRGEGGLSLREKWAAGPLTYLGLMVAGFPNLFIVAGPGSPSVLTNMVASVEQHVDWITDCLLKLRAEDKAIIEAEAQAEQDWVARLNRQAAQTLFMKGNSWYLGANVPGKPRVFMPYVGGLGEYRKICNRVAESGYRGFARR
jgi:cyclohexanone monooxygenase